MNKYLIYEGGQPIYLNDLDFLQSSFSDTVKGLCSALKFGEKNILMNDPVSMDESNGYTTYTIALGGYIVLGDEIYPIQAGSLRVPTSQPVYFVVVSEKYQTETLSNNTEVQVYERRYVKLSGAYAEGDIYVKRSDVTTVKDKLLSTVAEYLDKTITEADMKARLTLNNVLSGGCNMTYRLKQSGEETIYIRFIAAANEGTTMTVPEVNGKRRLFTFDTSVKNISGIYNAMLQYADNWDDPHSMSVQLIFDNGNCYIASNTGSAIEQMPGRTVTINNTFKI